MIMTKKVLIAIFICSGIFGFLSCDRQIYNVSKPVKEFNVTGYNNLYVEAIKQKLLGNIADALELFYKCAEINPASDASYFQIAQIQITRGDLVNGKKYLLKATEISPENLWYNMLLAELYRQQNKIDSLILCYERALKGSPDKIDLLVTLATLYNDRREFNKSRNIIQGYNKKFGANETTTLTLVETLVAEGKSKEALEILLKELTEYPDDITYNGYLAVIYANEGQSEKAREVYGNLIERNPDNPGIQLAILDFFLKEKSYGELFNLLNIVVLNDNIRREDKVGIISELIDNKDILKNYSQQLEIQIMLLEAQYEKDNLIYVLRPELLRNSGRLEESVSLLEDIIKAQPENYYAWERLLLNYLELKNYRKLEAMGKECATRFNRSVIAKMLYANGALENGNYNVALEELRKAEILAGDNQDIKLQILTIRADVYYRMSDYNNAFNAYGEALKMNKDDLTILNNYAYYLAEQNMNLKEAEKMAKIVIEKEKDNKTFLDTYAWVLYKRGKTREAARIMQRIFLSEEIKDAEYHEHYGFILKKQGNCKQAVEFWKEAIKIDSTKTYLKQEIEKCVK